MSVTAQGPPEYVIRPCTHAGLARAYGISPKVLVNWLRPHQGIIGPRRGYSYSLEQLFVIFEIIGWPPGPGGTFFCPTIPLSGNPTK